MWRMSYRGKLRYVLLQILAVCVFQYFMFPVHLLLLQSTRTRQGEQRNPEVELEVS